MIIDAAHKGHSGMIVLNKFADPHRYKVRNEKWKNDPKKAVIALT